MKKSLLTAILLPFLLFEGIAAIPGNYDIIAPLLPPAEHSLDKVHVDEVFSFTCSHCFELNKVLPLIEKTFEGKLEIESRPVGWVGHNPGRLYYIGVKKGKGQQVKDRIFSFVFEQGEEVGNRIDTKEILKNVAILEGLSREFDELMEDPGIVKKMNDSIAFAKQADIDSTPTLVIEGAIKTSRDFGNLFGILNSLLKEPVADPMRRFKELEREAREKPQKKKENPAEPKKGGVWKRIIGLFGG